MKKKGFTLVELLGVIVILAIVLSLAVVAYINSSEKIDVAYYKTVEESLLIPGGDYFNYNKGEQPGVFGDEKRVTIKELQDGGYIDDSVIDSEGNSCDLEKSYVGAYKDSIDKTNYYVCLTCGEYIKDEAPCGGKVSYTLGVKANEKTSKDVYNPNGKNWANENIVFTFETLNDMNTVVLENEAGNSVGSCNLRATKGIKSCTIEVDKSGNYKAYAKNGGKETRKQELKVLIDKVPPTFEIAEPGIKDTETNRNVIEVEIEAGVEDLEKEVKNNVINIKDDSSGIKIVESSLEYDEDKDYYKDKGIVTNFNITKSLKLGLHHLKVRVYDKAGNKTEKEVDYVVYKNVELPTFDTHCEDLTYNGEEQILTKEPGEGYTFENNKGTLADDYDVTIKLEENYRFSKEEKEDKILTCKIKQKPVTITAEPQTIEYQGSIVSNLNMVTHTELVIGHKLTAITLTKSEANGNSKVIPSNAKIKSGSTDVTSNYDIDYENGKLTVNPRVTISVSGTVEQEGYRSGAKVTVTCESVDNITNFTVSGGDGAGTIQGGPKLSKTVTLNTNGKNKTVTGVCTTAEGGKKEESKGYNIYVYSPNASACGCDKYNSCQNIVCGCDTGARCSDAGCSTYTDWSCDRKGYGQTIDGATPSQYTNEYEKLTDCWSSQSGNWYCDLCKRSCSLYKRNAGKCGCAKYNSCENSGCTCKTAKTCWHL